MSPPVVCEGRTWSLCDRAFWWYWSADYHWRQTHLGAAIGSRSFAEEYVSSKVEEWTKEIKRLAKVAVSQPYAAYAAFTHGMSSRWMYLMRTISNLLPQLTVVEQVWLKIPCLKGTHWLEQDITAYWIIHQLHPFSLFSHPQISYSNEPSSFMQFFHWCLQKTWAGQEERIRSKGLRSGAWSFHTPSSFYQWRNGKRSYYFL